MKKLNFISILLVLVLLITACAKAPVNPSGGETVSGENSAEQVPAPEPIVEKRVSFFGVGDNLIHNCVYWQAERNAGGKGYDFLPMYEQMRADVEAADIAYINQETVLGGSEIGVASYPLFNSPQEVGRDMIDLGFDVFSLATNHAFDKGVRCVKNTYEFFQSHPEVTCIGMYKEGEENIKVVEKNGVKIAFVNYTYHTNGMSLPSNSEYYVPVADYKNDCKEMVEVIQKADEMADFVICCVHWGDEGATKPNATQKESAKILADAGCDVIVGTHSHTIQPVEYIDDTLVIYSLGNFISAQNKPVNMMGGAIKFEFVLKGEEKSIENVQFEPLINQYEGRYGNIRIIPFKNYTEQLGRNHGVGVSYNYFKQLAEDTIDPAYLKLD
jgi:poly-gamma-glutamate synthesis protein (capsule biosynthesis protein)